DGRGLHHPDADAGVRERLGHRRPYLTGLGARELSTADAAVGRAPVLRRTASSADHVRHRLSFVRRVPSFPSAENAPGRPPIRAQTERSDNAARTLRRVLTVERSPPTSSSTSVQNASTSAGVGSPWPDTLAAPRGASVSVAG